MPDVFISYTRGDGAFVRRLHDALEAAGRQTWVDWEGIPPTAEWMREIHEAIEAAETFVAVLSPISIASEVCRAEVVHAAEQGKRLVPIVVSDVAPEATPEELARLNWIFFRPEDDFDAAFARLVEALDTDLDHLKLHTWLVVRSRRWTRAGEDPSALLRGSELATAEGWLAASGGKEPAPTPEQSRFILESRRREGRRQRRVLLGVAAALAISVTLGILAWLQRNEARLQRDLAVARSLATRSELALDETGDGLIQSALLAVESLALVPTEEGAAAWERAMELLPPPPLVEGPEVGETTSGALSPGGRLWAAGTEDGQVAVGDTATGELVASWQAVDSPVRSLAFSNDELRLAVGGREEASFWEIEGPTRLGGIDDADTRLDTFGWVRSMAFSADGERLYLAAESFGIEVVETAGWRRLPPLEESEASRFFELALHPRGEALVAAGFGLTLFDLRSGQGRRVPDPRQDEIDALVFSPEGHELAVAGLAVRIWDFDPADDSSLELRPADQLAPSDERTLGLALSGFGTYLAIGREGGTSHLLIAKNGNELDRSVESHPVWAVRFGDDGERLLTVADRFRARRARAGSEIARVDFGHRIEEVFFVAAGETLVVRTRGRGLDLLDPDTLERRLELERGAAAAVAASPDGRWLAVAGSEEATLYDAASLEPRARLALERSHAALVFSGDSRYLAVAGSRAVVLALDSLVWTELLAEIPRFGARPAFMAGGEWLAVSEGARVHLFRRPGWERVVELDGGVISRSPDGARLCSHREGARGVRPAVDSVWELATGEKLGSVPLPGTEMTGVRDHREGDVALAERCREWPKIEPEEPAPPPTESPRWRVEKRDQTLLVFARQPADRIAETCHRVPRQLTPEEWQRWIPDEPYRATCPGAEQDLPASRLEDPD